MKIVTIDFDIIMHPSIQLYQNAEEPVDEFLSKFDIGIMPADLELYKELTKFIMSFDKNKIFFIYDHHDIIEEISDIKEPFDLINIDFHHDIGYGDDMQWNTPLLEKIHEGNWVKHLWDTNRLKSYIWYKDYQSDEVVEEGEKYLTEEHFITNRSLEKLLDADRLYLCLSSPWVPMNYLSLYDLWEDLTNIK